MPGPRETLAKPPGSALVLVSAPADASLATGRVRVSAAFLAQLVATAQHAPETRRRSRASAPDAAARYTLASRREPPCRVRISV
ncbi:MAG: hypothetical protein IT536_06300 [Hyphomicrobiales bacterium]|nr:hypothetical protein [Hyphomicrobiales bacterium]